MTNNPFRKTLPELSEALTLSEETLLIIRRPNKTADEKLKAEVLADWIREYLGLPRITVGDTPPDDPQVGDLWVDTN